MSVRKSPRSSTPARTGLVSRKSSLRSPRVLVEQRQFEGTSSPLAGSERRATERRGVAEEDMLEYVAYALLGLVILGGLLYVTMSPEVEEPPKPPDVR
jgi:hypothetical protein